MKKTPQKSNHVTQQSFEMEAQEDPYEIIYADPRDEEIHLQILKKAQLNSRMARWFLDLEYNQLLWSDGVYEILEIDSKKLGASYDTFLKVIHPEDRPIKEETQKSLGTIKKPIEITYRLQMADGRIKWINEISSADYDHDEKPIRFYGIIQDITHFKLSENKFTQKEDNYKALINALPAGIATYQNQKITFINPAGVRIFDAKEANQLIGQPLKKIIHPDSITNFQKKMKEMAPITFEEKLIRTNGSVVIAEITPVPIIIDETPAVQIIFMDITERRELEKSLKKSEEKFRLLTVNLSDLQWTINPHGIVTYVNPFEENVIGQRADKIIKKKVSQFLTPVSVLSCLIELEKMNSINQSERKMEPSKLILETLSEESERKWIEVTTTAMYDSANKFIGLSGICQKIAKGTQTEHIMKEIDRLSEHEVQLKEVIATKDKFISIIAHDLRSPLNSVIGFLELLQTQYNEFSDSERKEHLGLISENATNTLNLLENLLVWARSQTGNMAFLPVKQKLTSIIQSIKGTFKQAINQKNLGFEILLFDEMEVFADTNMLVSILQNLISNAIKYSRPGGVIQVKAQETESHIEIMVSDNGMGMSKETMNKLFKVGEDISIPGTLYEKGSGLGLILCKDFIERHHGNILVESELGKGSQFTIRIPKI